VNLIELIYHIRNLDLGISFRLSRDLCGRLKSKVTNKAKTPSRRRTILKNRINLNTSTWRLLRTLAFKRMGTRCLRCGSCKEIHLDHVLPKSLYPHLVYKIFNVQPLCRKCNFAKNTHLKWDFRARRASNNHEFSKMYPKLD